ncbi:hypothetical protein [Clostridium taeniosporum]|uniref:DUF4355 domain-containing protein n=1 Tax=Clostridium taeniosporum TaxID=394958 RepID=A0A1D7XKL5_9CLOT|nr:hypothetical protein [Clostridium taeniosporum]AOR23893.1 hypothetical protein BGI42_09220 [Clostridium taeniosporum]
MELTELNLNEEQMQGVQAIMQSEGDKIRTKYNKQIKELESKLPKEDNPKQLALKKEMEDFKKEKLQFELSKNLESKGLSSKLATYLNTQGVEDLETYLNEFADIVGKQTNNYKPSNHNPIGGNITKEDFNKMGLMERTNLYNTNKQLYDILSK